MGRFPNIFYPYLLIIAFPFIYYSSSFGQDGISKERVIADYQKALAELNARFAQASGSGRHTHHRDIGSPSEDTRIRTVEFARSGENGKLVIDWGPAEASSGEPDGASPQANQPPKGAPSKKPRRPQGEVVNCFNKEYAFELTRAGSDKPYTVKYFGNEIDPVKSAMGRSFDEFWNCSTFAGKFPIVTAFSSPRFIVDKVTEETASGKRLLKIEFSFEVIPAKKESSKGKPMVARSGWFLVSPQEHWVLVGYGLRMAIEGSASKVLSSGRIEYDGEDGGIPIPKRVASQRVSYPAGAEAAEAQGKLLEEETFEFTKFRFGPVPDREFTAAAFGLPELDKPGPSRHENRTGLWLIGLAVIAFVGAMGLRYFASRHRKPA